MSIAMLAQVYDEARRLAVAGSVVADGDFRLKKLIPPLQQAGAKAPVFAKVADAVQKLVASDQRTASEALLDLCSLVNSILYTQGETGLAGELEPIDSIDLGGRQTQAGARALKPLMEALTTKGSGRLETIKESHHRGMFLDLRLVKAAVGALDDVYPEIADYMLESVLPIYGKAILPEVRAKFDVNGKAGSARRLKLMYRLDPSGSRETVKQALEHGSKEVKVVAIECLGDSPEDLSFLLEQARAKAKDVRLAALKSLHRLNAPEALAAVQKALGGADLDDLAAALAEHPRPAMTAYVVDEGKKQVEALLAEKDKKEIVEKARRAIAFVNCLGPSADPVVERHLLSLFDMRERLAKVKGDAGGQDLVETVTWKMASGSDATRNALVDAADSLAGPSFAHAFAAACSSRTPEQVFDQFSKHLRAKPAAKKKGDAGDQRALVIEMLTGGRLHSHGSHRVAFRIVNDEERPLDRRWLDLAVEVGEHEVVQALFKPGHRKAEAMLAEAFEAELKKSKHFFELQVLHTLVERQHPAALDAVVRSLAKHGGKGKGGIRSSWWIVQMVAKLPKSAAPELEALLTQLDDSLVEPMLEAIAELKNKT